MASDDGLLNQIRKKLVETKERWAREGRRPTGGGDGAGAQPAGRPRLPPGQHEVKTWPVLDLGIQPDIPITAWTLTVDGLVEAPTVWRWPDFLAQPRAEDVSDIHCVTSWSRYANRWEGVTARHLAGVVRPKPEARFVIVHSHDGYTTNLKRSVFEDDDVLLAYKHDSQPLSRAHGGPVRLVVPKLYFWKSAKWIKRIEFADHDRPGFWETRGYHNEADPWKEERYR